MRAQGEANAGQELPDLNTTMLVTVPTGYDAQQVANLINSVDEVEYVEAVMLPVSASPGDLFRFQDYLHPWSGPSTRFSGAQASGINAEYVWSQFQYPRQTEQRHEDQGRGHRVGCEFISH